MTTGATTASGRGPGEQREYWQEWYAKNRVKLMHTRRKRYVTDATYRERVKAQARGWYSDPVNRARKLEQSKERHRWRASLLLTIGRVKVRTYLLGELAGAVGVTKVTVKSWERSGVLPKAVYRTAAGWRLYTEVQVACIVETYREMSSPGPVKLRRFKELVWERLARIPKGVGEWRER